MTFSPYSPKLSEEPRHALPRILPFCCLRNLTFFGINIAKILVTYSNTSMKRCPFGGTSELKCSGADDSRLTPLLLVDIAAIDPGLDADDAVGGARLGET